MPPVVVMSTPTASAGHTLDTTSASAMLVTMAQGSTGNAQVRTATFSFKTISILFENDNAANSEMLKLLLCTQFKWPHIIKCVLYL